MQKVGVTDGKFDEFHSDSEETEPNSEMEFSLPSNVNTKKLTKFQMDIIAAVVQGKQTNFDPETEFVDRLRKAQNAYVSRLAKKRAEAKLRKRIGVVKAKASISGSYKGKKAHDEKPAPVAFNPSTHTITVNPKMLWKVLNKNKIRYTRVTLVLFMTMALFGKSNSTRLSKRVRPWKQK